MIARRANRPPLITSAPEGPGEELARRQRRYAWSACVFIGSFTAATVLHRETVLALLLCGVAMVTLVAAVVGANTRTPQRRPADPKPCQRGSQMTKGMSRSVLRW